MGDMDRYYNAGTEGPCISSSTALRLDEGERTVEEDGGGPTGKFGTPNGSFLLSGRQVPHLQNGWCLERVVCRLPSVSSSVTLLCVCIWGPMEGDGLSPQG